MPRRVRPIRRGGDSGASRDRHVWPTDVAARLDSADGRARAAAVGGGGTEGRTASDTAPPPPGRRIYEGGAPPPLLEDYAGRDAGSAAQRAPQAPAVRGAVVGRGRERVIDRRPQQISAATEPAGSSERGDRDRRQRRPALSQICRFFSEQIADYF